MWRPMVKPKEIAASTSVSNVMTSAALMGLTSFPLPGGLAPLPLAQMPGASRRRSGGCSLDSLIVHLAN